MVEKKSINKFFREIDRLKRTLEEHTGFNRKEAVWPFGHSRECLPEACFKRPDGLWEAHDLLNPDQENDRGGYGYKQIFLWRIKPNYCCQGQPVFSSDQEQAFLNESETEKILVTQDGYEIVWKWDTLIRPNQNIWGMKMGKTFYELRKNGKILAQDFTKAGFLRKVEACHE
jgi:hypothetical protein